MGYEWNIHGQLMGNVTQNEWDDIHLEKWLFHVVFIHCNPLIPSIVQIKHLPKTHGFTLW